MVFCHGNRCVLLFRQVLVFIRGAQEVLPSPYLSHFLALAVSGPPLGRGMLVCSGLDRWNQQHLTESYAQCGCGSYRLSLSE